MTVLLYLTGLLLVGSVAVKGQLYKVKGLECWTGWFDYDDPTTDNGDFELITNIKLMNSALCANRLDIEVQTLDGVSAKATGQRFAKLNVTEGFTCLNADQENNTVCLDYRVRFRCPPAFCKKPQCWTDWFDRDDGAGTGDWETRADLQREHPNEICNTPLDIEVRTVEGLTAKSTKDKLIISKEKGAICKTSDNPQGCQDYKVRFLCPFQFCVKKECWTKWFKRGRPSELVSWGVLASLKSNSTDKFCPDALVTQIKAEIDRSIPTGKVVDAAGNLLVNLYRNSNVTYQVRYMCQEDFCNPS